MDLPAAVPTALRQPHHVPGLAINVYVAMPEKCPILVPELLPIRLPENREVALQLSSQQP
jgi:hypothetical protein